MYDYVAGKLDWLAAGLPIEGRLAAEPRAGAVARADVSTCRLDERMQAVRERVRGAGWDTCVVVNDDDVVLGIIRGDGLDAGPDRTAEEAMTPAPSTFRPHVPAAEMAGFMGDHHLDAAPVTTSDGRLVGLLLREDAERAAHAYHDHAHG